MRYHHGMNQRTNKDLHMEHLYQVALHYYRTEGKWPTVRALRTALRISQKSAMDALKKAKHTVSIDEGIETSGAFAALCIYAGLERDKAIAMLKDLSGREINPQNGNSHLSRQQLRMILALQRPHIDSSKMTKAELLDNIINPAFLQGRSLVGRTLFGNITEECDRIKKAEEGKTGQTDEDAQHRQYIA